jgi:hypothetical protein
MSDKVIRPDAWIQNGQRSLEAIPFPRDEIEPGGRGPHDPGLEARVVALEADMKDVKASLGDIKLIAARIDERTGYLATGADLANLRSDMMVALETKATRGTVWGMGLIVAVVVIAAAAVSAIYMPYLAALLWRAGGP